jgi:hypothetical protein
MFVDEQTWAQKSACRRGKVEPPIEHFLVHDIPSTFPQSALPVDDCNQSSFRDFLAALKARLQPGDDLFTVFDLLGILYIHVWLCLKIVYP